MRLLIPTLEELQRALVEGAAVWRSLDRTCEDDAAPPTIVVQRSLARIAVEPRAVTWFTPRLLLVEQINAIVGSVSFKTAPDHPDGVEIGYGVAELHQGCGYATAGVRLLIAEAFAHGNVTKIVAEARADNLPSIGVLRKCGFSPESEKLDPEDGRLLRFHLFRDSSPIPTPRL